MPSKRRIGILTGGGDVPGLNVAIKAVVMRAQNHDIEVVGLRRGWASLLNLNPDDPSSSEKWLMPLSPENVRTIDRTGGTILHTSRTNPSNVKPGEVPRALIAEVPFDVERVCGFLTADRDNSPSNYAIVTVSEGAHPKGGSIVESGEADAYGHRKLGGIGQFLSEEIKTRTKVNIM